jgi:hypothetical protein
MRFGSKAVIKMDNITLRLKEMLVLLTQHKELK